MVLVTGANGFIGSYLVEQLMLAGIAVCATGRGNSRLPASVKEQPLLYETLDFNDPFAVYDVFEKVKPTAVVHAGAMGKPDECETRQWEAHQTNVESSIHLAQQANDFGAYLLFLSTDFVFDGKTGMYREGDEAKPVNFYGKTKLEAEEAIQEFCSNWGIVRTVLVYGAALEGRPNLLSILHEKLTNGEGYRVVDDQFRTPTFVEDLAGGIVQMIGNQSQGIFHLSGEEMMSPYEMAVRAADYWQLPRQLIERVQTKDLNHPAVRPVRTGLNIDRAKKELGYQPRSFEEGLQAMAARLK